jgi:hypothetical protein
VRPSTARGGSDDAEAPLSIHDAGSGARVEARPGEAGSTPTERSEFPVIRRSYQPVVDLDERLRRVFALLSLPPDTEPSDDLEPKATTGRP